MSLLVLGVLVDMAVTPEDDEELKKSLFHDQFKVKKKKEWSVERTEDTGAQKVFFCPFSHVGNWKKSLFTKLKKINLYHQNFPQKYNFYSQN